MALAIVDPQAVPLQLFALLAIGVVTGVLGGALGIGGGLVMIPALVFLLGTTYGPDSFHVFKLAALATAIVLSLTAIRQHVRAGAIVWPMVFAIVPLGLVGIAIGTVVARFFTGDATALLRRGFGVFMILVVIVNVIRQVRAGRAAQQLDGRACPVATRTTLIGTAVGLPSGIIGGLLGVGGGVWAVPVQTEVLGVRLPNAIANSACMIVGLAAGGAVAQTIAIASMPGLPLWEGWWIALWLAPGALLGGWFGGMLAHRIPVKALRYAFYVLLVITGVRLMMT